MLNFISSRLRTVNLQARLIIAFIFVSIIPAFIVGLISYSNSYRTLESNTITYSTQQADLLRRNIDNALEKYVVKVNEVSTNVEIIKYVRDYKSMDKLSQSIAFSNVYAKLKEGTMALNGIISIEVLDNSSILANTQYRIAAADMKDSRICREAAASPKRINWFGTRKLEYVNELNDSYKTGNSMAIVMSTKIRSYTDGKNIGFVNIAINEDDLYSVFKEVDFRNKDELYIADEDGYIVSHKDKSLLHTKDDPIITQKINGMEKLSSGRQPLSRYFIENIHGRNYIVSYAVSGITGWRVISIVDYGYLMSNIDRLKYIIFFIILLCIVVSLIVTVLVTNSITNPMRQIIQSMKHIEEGNFQDEVKDGGRDEIGYLARAFNQMVARIRSLITEIYDAQLQQREAELKALQAQINPHFLYNTLDSINWMAYISRHKEIGILVNSLSKFFRLSLNKGKEYYTIDKEIEHVKSYITIQEIRYRNKIKFHFDLSEETFRYTTIKLILQPLVENAIYHGIEPNGGRGNITISVQKSGEKIKMEVLDDGIGLQPVESGRHTDQNYYESSGYGLENIDNRIKLFFGAEYGLESGNLESGGFSSRIWIPAVIGKEKIAIYEDTAG